MSEHPEAPAAVAADVVDELAIAAAEREARQRKRLRQTVRDMLLSMLVVGGAVLLLVAPWNWSTPDPVKTVDATPVIAGARSSFDWPVLAPAKPPAGWRATSARIETAGDGQPVVVLGWVTAATEYLGLQQSPTKMTDFVPTVTLDGTAQGEVVIGADTWTRYVTADDQRRSLVRTADGVTYVVTGTGPWSEIEQLTSTLTPG